MDDVWPYPPEVGFKETYEFLTEVLRAYSAEQRLSLRKNPRLIMSYNHLLNQRQLAEAKLKARRYGQSGTMRVPVWGSQKAFALTSAQTVLDFGNDFILYYQYEKNQDVIIWQDWNNYIVRGISSVTPKTITLDAAVGENISNAIVMPLRDVVAYSGFFSSEDSPNQSYISVDFTTKESEDYFGFILYDLYDLDDIYTTANIYENPPSDFNDKYVQKTPPYRLEQVTDSILEPVAIIDNGFGPIVTEARFDYINNIQSLELFFTTQPQKATTVRDLFSGLRGRQRSFYLPTYNDDIVLSSGSYSSTFIDILDYGRTTDYVGRSIMIKENDGTISYRTVQSASIPATGEIRLTLDSSVSIDAATVSQVYFLNLVRFDTDSFEIIHNYSGQGRMRVNVIEVPN